MVTQYRSWQMPNDLDVEKALLGSLMSNKESFDRVDGLVNATDFFDEKHRILFNAIRSLVMEGIVPELQTVASFLEGQQNLKEIGGRAFLIEVFADQYTSANCETYARTIKEHSRRRHLIKTLASVVEEAENHADPDDLCTVVENVLVTNRSDVPSVESYLFDNAEDMLKPAQGVETGFRELDDIIVCLENGCLIIVGGFTGMGKSAFGYALARNAVLANHKAAIFDLEMTPKQRAHRIMSGETGKHLHDIRIGNLTEKEREACLQSLNRIPVMFFNNWNGKPSFVRTQLARIKQANRPELVVVDYLGFMRSDTKEERNDLMIGSITKSLKRTAQDMNIPIVLLSQFSRVKDEREPMLSDLRGSGDIEQDADVVLFVHRNKMTPDKASIIIAKNRQGGRGRVELDFYEEYASFNRPQTVTQSVFLTGGVR